MSKEFRHIKYHRIEGAKPGAHLLITAGVHGDEYEPIFTVLKLINMLENEGIQSGTLTLVPVVNQSAFCQSSRIGNDGQDLARTCPGKPKGTKTEEVAFEVSQLIREADFLVDLHTGGNAYHIAPLAGYMLHPDEKVLLRQREMAQVFNLPVVWGTNPNLEGRTLSVARDAHVPAIYTEYGGGGTCRAEVIEHLLLGCFNVMNLLDIKEKNMTESQVLYTVEDQRENSGHLQIMHPSPVEGIFEATVALDEKVEKGMTIGKIVNLKGKLVAEVPAALDGRMFLLRALPYVKKGDALGGVLPISSPGKVVIS